jgi:hypothetical protein
MTQPLLSILIPTVVGREKEYFTLLGKINPIPLEGKEDIIHNEVTLTKRWSGYTYGVTQEQIDSPHSIPINVEIISLKDNKELTIGEKRELLYQLANGTHSLMVDDDDELAPNAIKLILEAINSNPEIPCITFKEKCTINGEYKSSNHSIKYSQWMDNQDGYDYVRCPFYKDVIRTDIAKSVPFEHIRYNEDERWSMAIKPFLTDEIHIEEELYYYFYEPKESHNERYGITE